ncbi:MAG: ATP synthase subunit I [Pseudanabaena sp.]|nr:MAG: ATP synthase subunit I [Pseudanabaena sp.]
MKIIPAKSNTVLQTVVPTPPMTSQQLADSMEEYNRLKYKLVVFTIIAGVVITLVVWINYGWHISLSYGVGALVGLVYFRMLTKSVDKLGGESNRLGFARLGLFVLLMAIAAKSDQLEILPAFLGFMTYKAAVLAIIAQDLSRT